MALIRSIIKSGVHSLLAAYSRLKLRTASQPVLLILTYHRVLPADSEYRATEQPGMIVSPETLEQHIKLTKQLGAQPIHLNDWLERQDRGDNLPRLSVAFTFDDGWRDNYEHAYPILERHQVPATIFLVTRMIDTPWSFWPEQVIKLLTTQRIPETDEAFDWLRPYIPATNTPQKAGTMSLATADRVINNLKALDDLTILARLDAIYNAKPETLSQTESRVMLSYGELREMATHGLIRYGLHTRHHYRLNQITDNHIMEDEIVNCIDDTRHLGESVVPIFCYPNGDITVKGRELVAKHYDAACTTKTGWNMSGCDPYNLHRFNLHDGNSASKRMLLATIGRGLL